MPKKQQGRKSRLDEVKEWVVALSPYAAALAAVYGASRK